MADTENSGNDSFDERIMDHYEDPYHRGPFDSATCSVEGTNPICGDVIQVSLQLASDQTVSEAWFDGEGCVVSQASASMLMEKIEGRTLAEIADFSAIEMLELFGPQLVANRRKCCLLSWRVLQSAVQTLYDGLDDDTDGPNFGGPSLKEES